MGLLTPVAIRIGGISWMPKLLPQIVWVDQRVQKVSRDRLSLLKIAGLPSGVLVVAGRKSGIPRSTPLLCAPYGANYLIAGSYFGGPKEPIWVANLEAADTASLIFEGTEMTVTPRLLTGDDRARAWQHLGGVWPNFYKYEQRTNREIKVFELVP